MMWRLASFKPGPNLVSHLGMVKVDFLTSSFHICWGKIGWHDWSVSFRRQVFFVVDLLGPLNSKHAQWISSVEPKLYSAEFVVYNHNFSKRKGLICYKTPCRLATKVILCCFRLFGETMFNLEMWFIFTVPTTKALRIQLTWTWLPERLRKASENWNSSSINIFFKACSRVFTKASCSTSRR